jgi:serine/threonine protein kinase
VKLTAVHINRSEPSLSLAFDYAEHDLYEIIWHHRDRLAGEKGPETGRCFFFYGFLTGFFSGRVCACDVGEDMLAHVLLFCPGHMGHSHCPTGMYPRDPMPVLPVLFATPVLPVLLATGPLDPYVVKSLMWQLLNGLSYLHQNWVIHRDLKVRTQQGPSQHLVGASTITSSITISMHQEP